MSVQSQWRKLGKLASDLGWTDEQAHEQAGVESYKALPFDDAADLIKLWQRMANQKAKEEAGRKG